jgi:hypothetical protein
MLVSLKDKIPPDKGLSNVFSNLLDKCVFVRELARLQLRINELSINGQFETTAAGRLQLQPGDFLLVPFQHLLRQTDGFRFVISGSAVAQVNLHRRFLLGP